jgi:uncharacterized protein YecE (DUF72 family)
MTAASRRHRSGVAEHLPPMRRWRTQTPGSTMPIGSRSPGRYCLTAAVLGIDLARMPVVPRRLRTPELRIGCSGWNYATWRGEFYPRGVPPSRWLAHYAERFDTAEANGTFYRLPDYATFAAWATQTPVGFSMAVKASRFLTHLKRLREPDEPLRRLFERAAGLGAKLGPVLYQLPPQMRIDLARLEAFLAALPRHVPGQPRRRVRHVVEFRDPSWYSDDVLRLLHAHGVTLCLHDKRGAEWTTALPGPCLYVRFHGTSGHYRGSYGPAALDRWALRLAEAWHAGQDVYAYFNNDPGATATRNALSLRRRVAALVGR